MRTQFHCPLRAHTVYSVHREVITVPRMFNGPSINFILLFLIYDAINVIIGKLCRTELRSGLVRLGLCILCWRHLEAEQLTKICADLAPVPSLHFIGREKRNKPHVAKELSLNCASLQETSERSTTLGTAIENGTFEYREDHRPFRRYALDTNVCIGTLQLYADRSSLI